MNKIISKEYFSANVVKFDVEAPLIAKARKAGHFVIVRTGEKGERIPLTITSSDPERGTISLVIQAVGKSTRKLCSLEAGDYITDVVGPLGQATHVEKVGTVVCCGGGVGVAPLLPIVEAMKKAGNRVITVLAARTKELIILEEQVRPYSDEVIIMTDDGSYGKKGLVTHGVEEVINREKIRYSYDGIAQHDYGRRHRYVRRMSRYRRRKNKIRMRRRPRIRCSPSRFRRNAHATFFV